MDPFLVKIFLGEVQNQCDIAALSYNNVKNALDLQSNDLLWHSLQSFLIACANITKIFCPTQGDKTRGQELIQIVNIQNFAFTNKDARNYFEHFDENIDEWYKKDQYHIFIDTSFGPTNMFDRKPVRFFDTDKFAFIYGDKELAINPMMDSINDLCSKVNEILKKMN